MRITISCLLILGVLLGTTLIGHAQKRTLIHGKSSIVAVRFVPNGKGLVSASFNGTIIFWNTKTGEPMWTHNFDREGTDTDHTISHALAMDISPDGNTVAVSYSRARVVNGKLAGEGDNRISLLDMKRGEEKIVMTGKMARALRIAFSPDGRSLASGGPDGVTHLWDTMTGQERRLIETARGVSALTFSPDGKFLIIGQAASKSIRGKESPDIIVWDIQTQEKAKSFRIESDYVNDAAISPDGKLVAVVGHFPYEVALFSSASWQRIRLLKDVEFETSKITFSFDGRLLASAGASTEGWRICVWDVTASSNPRFFATEADSDSISFSPDGTSLAAGMGDGKIVLLQMDEAKR